MAMPEQVRKQSETTAKFFQEQSEQSGEKPEAAEDAVEDTGEQAVETTQQKEHEAAPSTSSTDFEQKYRSLQGMYNAEVPRLHAQNRELTSRVQQLEKLLSSMSEQGAKQQEAQTPTKLVTEQDIEDYGDSIDVMRRVFREEMSSKDQEIAELKQLVRQMQGTVVPQVQRLEQNYTVSSEQRFWDDLNRLVPDWQQVNSNQNFHQWLLEADELSGQPRQTYLDAAQRNFDAKRVANFFATWKRLNGMSDAQPGPKPQDRTSSELERQVAPGKGRTSGAKPAGEPKTYSPAEIREFFTKVQKGQFKGREEERDRIERDIFAAQREGRIVSA